MSGIWPVRPLHDSALSHTPELVKQFTKLKNAAILPQSFMYSLDVALWRFPFITLKKLLSSRHIRSPDEPLAQPSVCVLEIKEIDSVSKIISFKLRGCYGIIIKLKLNAIHLNKLYSIENYVIDREQKVLLEGYSSTLKSAIADVPRCSVLGPSVLFVYINDVTDNLENQIRLFRWYLSLLLL